MFTVILATNNSETIAVSKSITTILETQGVLRDESSIINPVIQIEASQAIIDAIPRCNYLIIPSFNRSYFVKDITSYRNTLYVFSCHVDVLTSFANEIKANKGIVHRQEKRWNLYLNDGVLKCYQNPITVTAPFPNDRFTGHTNVMLIAGSHGGGASYGLTEGGAGGTGSKNTADLIYYATSQLGNAYWYGTYGQVASADLYNQKKGQYPAYYTDSDFPSQYGQRVHDCVGLIKGYRWSDTPISVPVPVASEDVDVQGLWYQCSTNSGNINFDLTSHQLGMIVFNAGLTHCGVYVGEGEVIEARGHAYGVVQTNMEDRGFVYWGIPDWLQVTTGLG